MQTAKFLILFSILLFLLAACGAEAADISAQELLQSPEKYDGKTITYKGEVIGDIMMRADSAWLNVCDETGAIGVFCSREEAGGIAHSGSYKFTGDIISVRGRFNRFCSLHGGDTDIHAEKIKVLEKGKEITHTLDPRKVRLSIILPIIAFVLAIIHLITRRFR